MPLNQEHALLGQVLVNNQVKQLLMRSFEQKNYSHAYLFLGPLGSGKEQCAQAFAQVILCPHEGCGVCEDCERTKRGSHPDYQVIRPQGAAGYLVEQIRELIADINRAPIRSTHKIYSIERADLLGQSCANALLKTLEEPPAGVILILHAPHKSSVLPTIFSRCQALHFSTLPVQLLVEELVKQASVSEELARYALAACSYSLPEALEFSQSPTRQSLRQELLSLWLSLPSIRESQILSSIKSIMEQLKVPLAELEEKQQVEMEEDAEFLSKTMQKELQAQHKRELSACRLSYMLELLAIMRSCIQDMIDLGINAQAELQNPDIYAQLCKVMPYYSPAAILNCVDLLEEAGRRLHYSQNHALIFELLFFDMREVISCP